MALLCRMPAGKEQVLLAQLQRAAMPPNPFTTCLKAGVVVRALVMPARHNMPAHSRAHVGDGSANLMCLSLLHIHSHPTPWCGRLHMAAGGTQRGWQAHPSGTASDRRLGVVSVLSKKSRKRACVYWMSLVNPSCR